MPALTLEDFRRIKRELKEVGFEDLRAVGMQDNKLYFFSKHGIFSLSEGESYIPMLHKYTTNFTKYVLKSFL